MSVMEYAGVRGVRGVFGAKARWEHDYRKSRGKILRVRGASCGMCLRVDAGQCGYVGTRVRGQKKPPTREGKAENPNLKQ